MPLRTTSYSRSTFVDNMGKGQERIKHCAHSPQESKLHEKIAQQNVNHNARREAMKDRLHRKLEDQQERQKEAISALALIAVAFAPKF